MIIKPAQAGQRHKVVPLRPLYAWSAATHHFKLRVIIDVALLIGKQKFGAGFHLFDETVLTDKQLVFLPQRHEDTKIRKTFLSFCVFVPLWL
jgi:hypothetical protein